MADERVEVPPGVLRLATAALGTRVEVVIAAGAGDWRAAGEAALEEVEEWHARLSRVSGDSLVSRLARTAHRAPVRLDADTVATAAASAHILDPRTRAPIAARGIVAVTGPSARLADAWSTALAVLGSVPPGFPEGYRAMFSHTTTSN